MSTRLVVRTHALARGHTERAGLTGTSQAKLASERASDKYNNATRAASYKFRTATEQSGQDLSQYHQLVQ